LLVNFAELADHVVNEYEKCVLDQPIGAESKSETARFSKKSVKVIQFCTRISFR
jgi:hypothetical protein